jgi:hypothetical protein
LPLDCQSSIIAVIALRFSFKLFIKAKLEPEN